MGEEKYEKSKSYFFLISFSHFLFRFIGYICFFVRFALFSSSISPILYLFWCSMNLHCVSIFTAFRFSLRFDFTASSSLIRYFYSFFIDGKSAEFNLHLCLSIFKIASIFVLKGNHNFTLVIDIAK